MGCTLTTLGHACIDLQSVISMTNRPKTPPTATIALEWYFAYNDV